MSHLPFPALLKVSSTTAKRCGIILAFLGLFAFQAIHLDGDPSPMKGASDIDDEGFWQHNAREKVILGTFLPDELNQALIGSPLFTAAQYGVFSLLGVRPANGEDCSVGQSVADSVDALPAHASTILDGQGITGSCRVRVVA